MLPVCKDVCDVLLKVSSGEPRNRAGQTNGINFVTCSNGKVQLGGREGQMTMFEAYLSNLTGVYLLEISGLFPRFRSAGQPVYPHEPTGTTKIVNPPC